MTGKGKRKIVHVSSKGHCSLDGLADHEIYIAHKDPDGTIHLVPATAVPAAQVSRPRSGHALSEMLQDVLPDWTPPKDPWTDSSI